MFVCELIDHLKKFPATADVELNVNQKLQTLQEDCEQIHLLTRTLTDGSTYQVVVLANGKSRGRHV